MDINLNSLDKEIEELEILIKNEKDSFFSCVGCANQHQQILDWLIELKDYKIGNIGTNKENPSLEGYMTLDEAIKHTDDVIKNSKDTETIEKHQELYIWLAELKKHREKQLILDK